MEGSDELTLLQHLGRLTVSVQETPAIKRMTRRVPDAEEDLAVLPSFSVFSFEGDKDTASLSMFKWQTA